jgi:hypothetical protein
MKNAGYWWNDHIAKLRKTMHKHRRNAQRAGKNQIKIQTKEKGTANRNFKK